MNNCLSSDLWSFSYTQYQNLQTNAIIEMSFLHLTYPLECIKSPRTHIDENMEQSAMNPIWIPNEGCKRGVQSCSHIYRASGYSTAAHSPWVHNQHRPLQPQTQEERNRLQSEVWTHSSRKRKYSFLVSYTSTSWRIFGCFTLERTDHRGRRQSGELQGESKGAAIIQTDTQIRYTAALMLINNVHFNGQASYHEMRPGEITVSINIT